MSNIKTVGELRAVIAADLREGMRFFPTEDGPDPSKHEQWRIKDTGDTYHHELTGMPTLTLDPSDTVWVEDDSLKQAVLRRIDSREIGRCHIHTYQGKNVLWECKDSPQYGTAVYPELPGDHICWKIADLMLSAD